MKKDRREEFHLNETGCTLFKKMKPHKTSGIEINKSHFII
jgi:hypothetical protein